MEEKLKPHEIKELKFLNRTFKNSIPDYNTFKKTITQYGYDEQDIGPLYVIFANNFREDGKYEELTTIDRKSGSLIDTVKMFIDNPKMDYDLMIDSISKSTILGDYRLKNVDVDNQGLYLDLDYDEFMKYYSGVDEYNRYYYNAAYSSYGYDYEEVDSDEFNYALNGYPKEYRENLSRLAEMVGDLVFSEKVLNNEEEEGEFKDFLETYFPNKVDKISNEYLQEYGYVLADVRKNSVRECYEDEVKYTSKGRSDIFIPWGDLLEIILDKELVFLSDLKDAEINGDIELEDCHYQAYPSHEEMEPVYNTLNSEIEKLIETIEESEDLDGENSIANQIKYAINTLGFKREGKNFKLKTKNGLEFEILEFKPNGMISLEIKYPEKYKSKWGEGNKVKKLIPISDLSSYVNTIPLDRQDETIKKLIKQIIKEHII
jgi:hypothetical protein